MEEELSIIAEKKVMEEGGGGNENGSGCEGGIINTLISNLVSPRRSHGNSYKEEHKIDRHQFHSSVEAIGKEHDVPNNNDDEKMGGAGGVVNNFISNFFHKNDAHDQEPPDEGNGINDKGSGSAVEGQGEINGGTGSTNHEETGSAGATGTSTNGTGGGGIINSLVSSFFHQNEDNCDGADRHHGQGNDQKLVIDGHEVKEQKVKEEEGVGGGGGVGTGGIFDNLVSSLPATLQGNVAPATDEASILIHSIIHD